MYRFFDADQIADTTEFITVRFIENLMPQLPTTNESIQKDVADELDQYISIMKGAVKACGQLDNTKHEQLIDEARFLLEQLASHRAKLPV